VRDARSEFGVAPRDKVTLEVPPDLNEALRALLALHANATLVDGAAAGGDQGAALAAVAVRADPGALRVRYARDVQRLRDEVERAEKKLANEKFVANAKPDVVDREREKLAAYRADLERTQERLATLERA
jgi:valyl-tRNA synthetase